MARKVKGCMTTGCVANKKKIKYKNDDNFCLKCGSPLVEVCKKCYTPLPANHAQAICDRCIAEKADKKDKGVKAAEKAGAGAVGVAGLVVAGKKVLDIAKGVILKM